jgi:hypothetical protein
MNSSMTLPARAQLVNTTPAADLIGWPLFICVLGGFRLLSAGQQLALRNAEKICALLAHLAIQDHFGASREHLIQAVWPNAQTELAGQCLAAQRAWLNVSTTYHFELLRHDRLTGTWVNLLQPDNCSRLTAERHPQALIVSPASRRLRRCRGAENRLYRVEVHRAAEPGAAGIEGHCSHIQMVA